MEREKIEKLRALEAKWRKFAAETKVDVLRQIYTELADELAQLLSELDAPAASELGDPDDFRWAVKRSAATPQREWESQESSTASAAPPDAEQWEVVPGTESDDWGIRRAGEKQGKSIAQMLWERDADEIVALHNAALAAAPPTAGEEKS